MGKENSSEGKKNTSCFIFFSPYFVDHRIDAFKFQFANKAFDYVKWIDLTYHHIWSKFLIITCLRNSSKGLYRPGFPFEVITLKIRG